MFYTEYTDRIKGIVAKNKERKSSLLKSREPAAIGGLSGEAKKHRLNEQKLFSGKMHFKGADLMSTITATPLENAVLGVHEDFKHLIGTDETENHWIVSVFVDIQGSTNLFREYDLDDIYSITNTIQAAEIHTIIALGGHVQRLQGDGVLAYFGGRNIKKQDAVRMAMVACSFISYFVKNDLKNIFLRDGIEEISTRIGIDFGDDEDVLWANFGVDHISELTTLSLHTSLASKMQANAATNGIVAGQHIKDRMPGDEAYFKIISEGQRYIFKDLDKKLLYTQWAFDWYGFLRKQSFILSNADGTLALAKTGAPAILPSPKTTLVDYSGLAALASISKPHYKA